MVHASGYGLPKIPHMLLKIVAGASLDRFYSMNIIFLFFILVNYNDNMKKSSKQKCFVDALDHKKAWCAYRHKYIELSSSGVGALTDHAKGKKHQYALLRS